MASIRAPSNPCCAKAASPASRIAARVRWASRDRVGLIPGSLIVFSFPDRNAKQICKYLLTYILLRLGRIVNRGALPLIWVELDAEIRLQQALVLGVVN